MATKFHHHIRTALADAQLQSALDGNAERRLQALTQAFASLPEGRPALRARAHAMRLRVIDHLEDYLAEFSANAAANGITIHRAADAAQALHIVSQIAQNCGAKRIAKSKTMVGEEIHLNERLEAEGLKVVETDLGEYIVQLRGEPPAHIITPAVHLTRSQVGQTFEEKLGLPYTTDIPTLTAAARRVLRQTFLDADIGVSGVNAGVVESGTLCLVTNEGNGRMCTTLPDIHIALMGIERLVPTFDDLALLLIPAAAFGYRAKAERIYQPDKWSTSRRRERRPVAAPPGLDRQRAQGVAPICAGRGALLHPLWSLPERLPGLPRDRRACLYQRQRAADLLSGADRIGYLAGVVWSSQLW